MKFLMATCGREFLNGVISGALMDEPATGPTRRRRTPRRTTEWGDLFDCRLGGTKGTEVVTEEPERWDGLS